MATNTTAGLLSTATTPPTAGQKPFFPPAKNTADYVNGAIPGLDQTVISQQAEDVYPVFTAFTASNAPDATSTIIDPFTGNHYTNGNQIGNAATGFVWYTANPVWKPGEAVDPNAVPGFLDSGGNLNSPQNISPQQFQSWPSSYQIYYLYNCPPYPISGPPQGLPIGSPPHLPGPGGEVDIGGPVANGGDAFILSSDLFEAINMSGLNNTSFAALPPQDQNNIGETDYFKNEGGALALGLTNSSNAVATLADVQSLFEQIQPDGTLGAPSGTFTAPGTGTPLKPSAGTLMSLNSGADADVFNSELANIYKQCQANKFYNLSNIQTQIQAVLTRFQNAAALGNTPLSVLAAPLGTATSVPPAIGAINYDIDSLDNNGGIVSGYTNLMDAERNIQQIQTNLINPSTVNQNLDAPALVSAFLVQLKATSDAINAGQAEMVNQQSNLLNCYTQMEQLISQTVAMFDPTSQGQTLSLLGNTTGYSTLSTSPTNQQLLVSMFNKWSGNPPAGSPGDGSYTLENPIEKLQTLPRPLIPIMDDSGNLSSYYQSSWNAYNQEIQDSATQMQQNTSLATNTLSAQQQLGDQEYSLANSVLSQANEVIQSVGRGFA